MSNELMKRDMFFDVSMFEQAQRVAKALSTSTMVPDHFKNNIGNCLIALNFANRTGLDIFMLMQKMYVIHGKPGIESQLAVALINRSGKFSDLEYKFNKDKTTCVAYATNLASGQKCVGPEVSLEMAKAEGWLGKQGSKWKTMPEMMLSYRAAMFFARRYCPDALMGFYSDDELKSVQIDVTPKQTVDIEQMLIENETDTGELKQLTVPEIQEMVNKYDQEFIDTAYQALKLKAFPADDDLEGWTALLKAIEQAEGGE